MLETILNNELFQGGFILMFFGGLMVYFKKIPIQIYYWVKRQLIYQYTIESNDDAFLWLIYWFQNNLPEKKLKKAIVMTDLKVNRNAVLKVGDESRETQKEKMKVYFKPDTIFFLFKFHKTLVICHVNREKMESKDGNLLINFYETISFYYYSKIRGQILIQNLIQEAYSDYKKREDKRLIKIKIAQYDRWSYFGSQSKRSQDSIIFNSNTINDLIIDIKKFINSEQWYSTLGIPYKRGYLLYGPPGNGKTSIIHVIASNFNFNINFLNLGNSDMSDTSLMCLMSKLNKSDLLVLEDIDIMFLSHDTRGLKSEKTKLTFSGLLNALDGFISGNQFLVFMTTNHRQKLDPALIRPGRIDYEIHVENASHEQILKMFRKFYPSINGSYEQIIKKIVPENTISMSKIQEHLLNFNKEDAINNLSLLLK